MSQFPSIMIIPSGTYLILVLCILIGDYILSLIVETLNIKNISTRLPAEFDGFYDAVHYKRSQEYLRENTRFGLFSETISLVVTVAFILLGGFGFFDLLARSFGFGSIITGLVFALCLKLLADIIDMPFSVYDTFVIEEKYGFNRTTVKTFILDIIKGWFLSALIGLPVFGLVIWFFEKTGSSAWLYCWIALTGIQLILAFLSPVLIMPLFNKFEPLKEGELKDAIEKYARSQNFKMKGVFTMDASKRSSKTNAFFTGFGRFRRIVLCDTLIEKHTTDEIVSVLAHEMGHYKKRHVLKHMGISFASAGLMFFILSFFINNSGLLSAFGIENVSVYASLVLFAFIYSPVSILISIAGNIISRRHEYAADEYAAATYGKPQAMVTALKKLSVDNLSNLTPHPLKIFLEYSHPPVLARIKHIDNIAPITTG